MKQLNEMTLEEMKEYASKLQQEQQEKFMLNLLDQINNLCEKANRRNYSPTVKELQYFSKIVDIIDDMKNWF